MMVRSRKYLKGNMGVPVPISKESPSEKQKANEGCVFIRENVLPAEMWSMVMDNMDSKTLYTTSLVSGWHSAMAQEKMEKLKSSVLGTFVNIKSIEDIPGLVNRIREMRSLVISKDNVNDLTCCIFKSFIIGWRVVQRQLVATIKLLPKVDIPAGQLDQNGVDQTMEVGFNITKHGNKMYGLEILWTGDDKIKLMLNKLDGTLVQTIQSWNQVEEKSVFTEVPIPWQHFVSNKAGIVRRLDVTNIKLRTSRRKVDEKQLLPRLYAALRRTSVYYRSFGHHVSPIIGNLEMFPWPAVKVGEVDLLVVSATSIVDGHAYHYDENNVDHLGLLRRELAASSSGSVVFSPGLHFTLVGRVLNGIAGAFGAAGNPPVIVKYKVMNTSPSPACLVEKVEQLRIVGNIVQD